MRMSLKQMTRLTNMNTSIILIEVVGFRLVDTPRYLGQVSILILVSTE
jgi:hypothetical protein